MGRVVVVTGGSRGIGEATALALAERGWSVVVGYHADGAAAEAVRAACEQRSGLPSLAVGGDVASEADVARLFEAADSLGPLGGLVNNAGVADARSEVADMTAARVARLFAVNVVGAFACAAQAVRRLSTARGGEGGVIVNVSSAAARLGSPGEWVDYAATKGALDTMTIGLAREVAAQGIRVNAVRPGLVDTEMHARVGRPARVAEMAPTIPMQRAGEPEEVAAAVAWLCSPDASYVTGALVDVSGGR